MTSTLEMLLRLSKCTESEHHKMYQAIGQLCPCCEHRELRWELHGQVMKKIFSLWHSSPGGTPVGLFKKSRMRTLEEALTFFQEIQVTRSREESNQLVQAFQDYKERETIRRYKLTGKSVKGKIGFVMKSSGT